MSNNYNETNKANNRRDIEKQKNKNQNKNGNQSEILRHKKKFTPICENCKKSINEDEFIQFDDCQENHYYHKNCIKRFEGCNKCYGNKIKETKKNNQKIHDKNQNKKTYNEKYINNNLRDLSLEINNINNLIDNFHLNNLDNYRPRLLFQTTTTYCIM